MMAPDAAMPIAARRFANLICWMCSVQPGALSRSPNNSLIYPHNKNGKPLLPWRRPNDKRSELQLLDCLKAKKLPAIALTRSARWNQISALKHEQLYRRNSKIQWRGGVAAWRRGGVAALPAFRRYGVSAYRRGGATGVTRVVGATTVTGVSSLVI